jgi:hypothetical protein
LPYAHGVDRFSQEEQNGMIVDGIIPSFAAPPEIISLEDDISPTLASTKVTSMIRGTLNG